MVALLIAASMGLLVTLVGTPVLIRAFQARGIGQQIRDDGPEGHATKAGTPTMGGLMVVLAAIVGYTAAHVPRLFSRTGATFTAEQVGDGFGASVVGLGNFTMNEGNGVSGNGLPSSAISPSPVTLPPRRLYTRRELPSKIFRLS